MGISWFLEFKNQIKRRGWILTALTTQNTTNHCCVQGLVATSSSPPQWSSAAQAGQSNTCDSDKKNCSTVLFPKGCTMGIPASCWTSSFQIALSVLARGCILEMIKVLLSNSKQDSCSASVNMTECSWLRGGGRKRGAGQSSALHAGQVGTEFFSLAEAQAHPTVFLTFSKLTRREELLWQQLQIKLVLIILTT